MAISLEQYINNLDRISKQGTRLLKNEILNLFEPVVFQYVLYTRPDTGNARKSIGLKFAQMVNSQRIIDATEYDVEVSHDMYNHWKFPSDDQWNGTCASLVNKGLLKVVIVANDRGLYEQEVEDGLPSKSEWMEENRPDNTETRMPPNHITKVNDIVSTTDLENFNTSEFLPIISNDIKLRVKELIKKLEMEMFK